MAAPSEPEVSADLPTVFIIDGHGYIFRAYYAVRQLSTSTGFSTNALFGFCNMLVKVLRERRPQYMAIAFDPGGKNFRHELYPAYKANRSAPPEDLPAQIPLIHRAVDLFRIHRLHEPGYEADDLIGTVARQLADRGHPVRIITGDKDLYQLVDDRIQLVDDMRAMRGGDTVQKPEVDRDEVIQKFGVPPERVIDVLALAGDSSDNIPGVKGIGLKTAAQLVNEYGDLEAVLEGAKTLKQKARRERLLEHQAAARLSRELVTIRTDLPFRPSLEELRYDGPDLEAVRAFFEEYELKRLLSDPIVRGEAPVLRPPRPTSRRPPQGQQDMFAPPASSGAAEQGPPMPGIAAETRAIAVDRHAYRVVTDAQALAEVTRTAEATSTLGLAVLLDAAPAARDRLVGVALSWGEGEGAYIPVGHDEELVFPSQLEVPEVAKALAPLLGDPGRKIAVDDGKACLGALDGAGVPPFRVAGDPTIASYLLDPEGNGHDVPAEARRRFGYDALTREQLCGKGKSERLAASVAVDEAAAYCGEHADLARRLLPVLDEAIEAAEMTRLYQDLELPLEAVLAEMELTGLLVDTARLTSLGKDFEEELQRIEQAAWAEAGGPFNLGSPKQVAELLFEKLKLRIVKRTQTGPSTDSQVLEELRLEHPLPGLILDHRTVAKLKNTYVDVLPQIVRASTGRVHTRFNQNVAATGRLSSSEPNLQNIPTRTDLGRKIRDAFVAPPGSSLISLDYSQIELRILAQVSGDPVLVEAFERGEDVHQRTAAEIFDVPTDAVTREQRNQAKTINFGLLYGMGVLRLSRELGIKRTEAKAYLAKYFERLAGIRAWHDDVLNRAHHDGYVRTLFGRRRLLPTLQSANRGEVARAERLAINTPIQGSAADMIKRAMLDVSRNLKARVPSARLLLQVHDELLLEAPEADVEACLDVTRSAMLDAAAFLRVPMVVDAHAGHSWAEVH